MKLAVDLALTEEQKATLRSYVDTQAFFDGSIALFVQTAIEKALVDAGILAEEEALAFTETEEVVRVVAI